MIEKRTVLILGAGASIPYGFPSGRHLRELILRTAPLRKLMNEIGFEWSLIDDFQSSLQAADPPSVDVFLEGRQDLLEIGKAAIAAALLPFESDSALFAPWLATEQVKNRTSERWYGYFA